MAAALVAGLLATPTVWAQTPIVAPYCNDFETGVEGGGGSFGAQQIALVNSGDLGSGIGPAVGYGGFGHRFGGYSDVWPAGGFTASTDIYIPTTDHGLGVEENRDYSVALNRAYECDPLRQRRDYVFNWGYLANRARQVGYLRQQQRRRLSAHQQREPRLVRWW